jgi:hypothetical protein
MEEVLRHITECEQKLFGVTSLGAMQTDPSPSQRTPIMRKLGDSGTVRLGPNVRPPGGTASPLTRSDSLPAPPPSRLPAIVAMAMLALAIAVFAAARMKTRVSGAAPPLSATLPIPASVAPPATSLASEPPRMAAEEPAASASVAPPPPATPLASASASTPAAQTRVPRWTPPRNPVAPLQTKPPQDSDIKLQR